MCRTHFMKSNDAPGPWCGRVLGLLGGVPGAAALYMGASAGMMIFNKLALKV